MMEGKWTKGPWGARGSYIYGNDGGTVASVFGYYEANARLIAQAPAMVKALEKAAAKFREYERLHRAKNTVDGAMKAISNAAMAAEIEALLTAIKGE